MSAEALGDGTMATTLRDDIDIRPVLDAPDGTVPAGTVPDGPVLAGIVLAGIVLVEVARRSGDS